MQIYEGVEVDMACVQTANALAKGVHVPFRQHSLTANLKGALDGSCRTTVLAHISFDVGQLEETVSTLRFAERMRRITTNAKVAEVAEPEMLLRRYERQVRSSPPLLTCTVICHHSDGKCQLSLAARHQGCVYLLS